MNVKDEITRYSSDNDRPILLWLLYHYRLESQWAFVAECRFERYGGYSYETNRVWSPTPEGRILYNHFNPHPLNGESHHDHE